MRPPRILVVHASVGGGHARAAAATAAAVRREDPSAEVEVADALELARPLFRRVYGEGYLRLIEKAPSLFGALYRLSDRVSWSGDRLRRAVQRWGAPLLERLLQGDWDVVVHTHFLAPELAAGLRRRGRLSVPQLVVVTDYDAHRLWAHEPCERYCVGGALAAASLRRWGVPARAIRLTGIPVDPAFARSVDARAARRSFGLAADRPIVLQSAGGHGVGPIEATYRALLSSAVPAQFVVVCGRNERVRASLAALRPPARHRALVLGYTERMRELMACADALVTKPGGLTVSEALACGLPMVLVDPIPGHEERNAGYLRAHGAALSAESPASAAGKLESLLSDPRRLESMREAARKLGTPGSAQSVALQALELARWHSAAHAAEPALSSARTAARAAHAPKPGLQMSAVAAPEAAAAK